MVEKTNWIVFTGPPSSGKTTLIHLLDALQRKRHCPTKDIPFLKEYQATLKINDTAFSAHLDQLMMVFQKLDIANFSISTECFRDYLNDLAIPSAEIKQYLQQEESFRKATAYYIAREKSFAQSEYVFMDRAIPDHLSYFSFKGYDIEREKHVLAPYLQVAYKAVFVFEKVHLLKKRINS
ncbi:MAG TPA: hypothetical protein VNC84_06335 [Gammaproteobacteria bacterium]|nr:hypothetical protein [Gammaproteobacteria bacterium]